MIYKKIILPFLLLISLFGFSKEDKPLLSIWKDTSNSPQLRSKVLSEYCTKFFYREQNDSLWYYTELNYNFCKKWGLQEELGDVHNVIGIIHLLEKNSERAEEELLKAHDIYDTFGNLRGMADVVNNLGAMYYRMGEINSSNNYYKQAINYYLELEDFGSAGEVYNNFGLVYTRIFDWEEALKFYSRAQILMRQSNLNYPVLGQLYLNMSAAFEYLNQIDSAFLYAVKAEQFFIKNQKNNLLGSSLEMKSTLQLKKGDTTACLLELKRVIPLLSGEQYYNLELSSAYTTLTQLYLGKDTDSAIYFGRQALELLNQEKKQFLRKSEVLRLLNEAYKRQGMMPEAIDALKQRTELQQKLLAENQEKEIYQEKIELDYNDLLKVENERFSGRLEQKKNKWNLFFISTVLLVLILGIGVFFFFLLQKKKQDAQYAQLKLEFEKIKKDKETALTINQINKVKPLNVEKIHEVANFKLNETDWKIIKVLYEFPHYSNLQIAEQIYLSSHGVKSSLKKMYRIFSIQESKSKRLALIVRISKL